MDPQDREEAATTDGYTGKHLVHLTRFAFVLVDQTLAAELSPAEMRYVAAVYRQAIELRISENQA